MCQAMSSSHCYSGLFMWYTMHTDLTTSSFSVRQHIPYILQQQRRANLLHVILHQNDHVELKTKWKCHQRKDWEIEQNTYEIYTECTWWWHQTKLLSRFVVNLRVRQNNILIFNHRFRVLSSFVRLSRAVATAHHWRVLKCKTKKNVAAEETAQTTKSRTWLKEPTTKIPCQRVLHVRHEFVKNMTSRKRRARTRNTTVCCYSCAFNLEWICMWSTKLTFWCSRSGQK